MNPLIGFGWTFTDSDSDSFIDPKKGNSYMDLTNPYIQLQQLKNTHRQAQINIHGPIPGNNEQKSEHFIKMDLDENCVTQLFSQKCAESVAA